jgi:hypothetical protein
MVYDHLNFYLVRGLLEKNKTGRVFHSFLSEHMSTSALSQKSFEEDSTVWSTFGHFSYVYSLKEEKLMSVVEEETEITDFKVLDDIVIMGNRNKGASLINKYSLEPIGKIGFEQTVSGICVDHEENLWISYDNNGVLFYQGFNRALPGIHKNASILSLNQLGKEVSYVLNGSEIRTVSNQLLYRSKGVKSIDFFFRDSSSLILNNNKVHIFRGGRLAGTENLYLNKVVPFSDSLLGLGARELLLFDFELKSFRKIHPENEYGNNYRDIIIASDTLMYFATSSGLRIYNHKNATWKEIAPNESLYGLRQKGDTLWVLGETDLYYLSEENLISINEGTPIGLKDCRKLEVWKDEFWIGSKIGLHRIKQVGDTLLSSTLTTRSGLYSNSISDLLATDDTLYVATKKGLNFIDTTVLDQFLAAPKLNILSINVDGIDKSRQREINLEYNENNIGISFKRISYHIDVSTEYRYRLSGLDDWNYTQETSARYSYVPPGDYEFQVEVLNDRWQWSERKSVSIFIQPPFWQTWWFYGLIVLMIIFLTALITVPFYRLKIRNVRRQAELSESLVKYRQIALSKQMNPHFIFNSMNSIQSFVLNQDAEKSSDFIARFSRLMRKVLQLSDKNLIRIADEMETLSEYIELEQLRFSGQFDYKIIIDHEKISDYLIPPMVLQPFVENAIWHGFARNRNNNRMEIRFNEEYKTLKCTISDNGLGRKKNKVYPEHYRPMGTSVTKKRIEELNALYELNLSLDYTDLSPSEEGWTTIVTITLPKISDSDSSDG